MNTNSTLPETGFLSLNPKKDIALIMMSFIINDTITLSPFSVIQLISGVGEFQPNTMIKSEVAILMSKLFSQAVFIASENNISIDVSRDDVVMLRTWLETRMIHCEKERDEENRNAVPAEHAKFSPDTYIGMKLLLIELREWLLGERVIQPEYAEPVRRKEVSYPDED